MLEVKILTQVLILKTTYITYKRRAIRIYDLYQSLFLLPNQLSPSLCSLITTK